MRWYTYCIVAIISVTTIISCISPPFPEYILLQHIPTIIALILISVSSKKFPISPINLTFFSIFLLLHILGARYSYSYVPYDDWSASLFGTTISQLAGWSRNHYDRLVHFCYGLLLAPVVQEILVRYVKLSRRASLFFAVEFIMASSMAYEVIEWIITLFFASEAAEAYNGQQGDMWDAQKDMALATVGAILSAGWLISATGKQKI